MDSLAMLAPALIAEDWCPAMARDLAIIADDETPLDWYARGVESGALGAWSVYLGFDRVGTLLWRRELDSGEPCFVIVAAVGNHPAVDLMHHCSAHVERIAKSMGCRRVRFHTKRRALAEKARALGYGTVEYACRKVVL